MRKKIYVAGPYTAKAELLVKDNVVNAIAAGAELIKQGFSPYIPHLFYYIDPQETIFSHEVWFEVDLSWLIISDGVLRLEGDSVGADFECQKATELGIPVFRSIEELKIGLGT